MKHQHQILRKRGVKMNKYEGIKAIDKLKAIDRFRRLNETFVMDEYVEYLKKLDFKVFEKMYDNIKFSYNEIPTLCELQTEYSKHFGTTVKAKACTKCIDGLVPYYVEKFGNKYQHFAICTCERGKQQFYDGRECKDAKHRTNYYTPTLAELGIEE